MSSWPEAVWILRELQSLLNFDEKIVELNKRIDEIENRYFIAAAAKEDGGPDIDITKFNKESLWFIISNEENE